MAFGVTADGFNRKTFNDLVASVEARARGLFGAPNLDIRDPDGFLANVYLPLIEEASDLWELAEIVYYVIDPLRATRQSYATVAALRGVQRKIATIGTHEGVEFSFDGAVAGTIARGDIRFNPEGSPENVWINSEDFVIGSSGGYLVAVESELTGSSKTLLISDTIEVIDGPGELTGIVVPSDAVAGTDLETEVAWRTRADAVIDEEQTTVGAAVEDVAGVIKARVLETPGRIRVIVNDGGGGAANNAIAQAILDSKAEGVTTLGALSGEAVDEAGVTVTIFFDRVATDTFYVEITVKAPGGASTTDIKNALIAAMPTTSGKPVVWSKLNGAAVAVTGVEDVTELLIGVSDPPTLQSNVSADQDEGFSLVAANIDVTITS